MLKPSRIIFWALLLGTLLRVYGLGSESLWLDEATTVRRATEMSFAELRTDAGNGTQQPLYFWVSKIWCGWFGTNEFWLRFPAMVFGVLGILMIYHFGRKLFSAEAGMWAAIFLALNPYMIHYSQEARPYTLFVLLAMVSWYFWLQLMRSVRPGALAGYVIFTAAALYTHPYGGLLMLTHFGGWLIYRRVPGFRGARREWRLFAIAFGVTVLLFLPQLLYLISSFQNKLAGTSPAGWIPAPDFLELFSPFWRYFTEDKLAAASLLVVLVAGVLRALANPKVRPALAFVLLTAGIFTLLPWLVSVTLSPIYVTRYTIPLLPLVLIVLGWAVAGLELLPRRITVAVLVALSLLPIYNYHTLKDKTPWREGVQELTQQVRAGDLVIWAPFWVDQVADYYFEPPGGVRRLHARSPAQISPELAQARRVWLVGMPERFADYETPILTATEPSWQRGMRIEIGKDMRFNPHAVYHGQLELQQFIPAVDPGRRWSDRRDRGSFRPGWNSRREKSPFVPREWGVRQIDSGHFVWPDD